MAAEMLEVLEEHRLCDDEFDRQTYDSIIDRFAYITDDLMDMLVEEVPRFSSDCEFVHQKLNEYSVVHQYYELGYFIQV